MLFAGIAAVLSLAAAPDSSWDVDFARQPIAQRPRLEVRYTDGTRTKFEVLAEAYHILGEMQKPHRLLDADDGSEWLSFELVEGDGTICASRHVDEPSRINLYRRGPYYCEVHWLDVQFATGSGTLMPLRGDVALYCYPDKILASATLHATADMSACTLRVRGKHEEDFALKAFDKGMKQMAAFPLAGETAPLPGDALETVEAVAPLHYDAVRGCYLIGSLGGGGFQGRFYEQPNLYDRVRFRVTGQDKPRTIYVCHFNTGGDRGSMESGVILDADGHPLPVTVQNSKNFAGEKEEKFYNPHDTPFSETYFPLHLEPGETADVTALHLYQNWGQHMVKQFSSLGAWMDYFHSSTGVTETTCYVPFKFAGLPGVAIADFRAMSQSSFWGGQPQHDNIAGHSFLSYKTDAGWQYMTYRGTTYRSTGSNWMDIGLEYLSTDGAVRGTVDTFELPQTDELRNFIHVRYEVLKPLVIENAAQDFRLLTVASWVQRLRYTHFAASRIEDQELSFEKDHFGASGVALPEKDAFLALYGERKGSNAIILRTWSGPMGPAASVWCEKDGDTRLLLVPGAERLELKPGDVFEFGAFWLPYGPVHSADTPRRETVHYGSAAPRVTDVTRGQKLRDFPSTVRAHDGAAEFTIQGGRDIVPVIVTGLSDYRRPKIERKESAGWHTLSHARVNDKDGVQVFCDGSGSFGAVFLVESDDTPQRLRVMTEDATEKAAPRIGVSAEPDGRVALKAPWMDAPVMIAFPALPGEGDGAGAREWHESVGGGLWFQEQRDKVLLGGRVTPNEDDVDLELWIRGVSGDSPMSLMELDVSGTRFAGKDWFATEGKSGAALAVAGEYVAGIAWPAPSRASEGDSGKVRTNVVWPPIPGGRRGHARGTIYLMKGSPDDVPARIRREVGPRARH